MMTKEEIMRAKAAGAQKRAERQAKREAEAKARELAAKQIEILGLPDDFEQKLKSTWWILERARYEHAEVSRELVEEVKNLFLPNAKAELRFKAYQRYFHDYETLIFYAWITSKELCDAAFNFWDEVLKNPEALFSGNSILRILGGRPNENLLKIIQNHRERFFTESDAFKKVMGDLIARYLREPGLWNFETKDFDAWTDEEREILEKINELF